MQLERDQKAELELVCLDGTSVVVTRGGNSLLDRSALLVRMLEDVGPVEGRPRCTIQCDGTALRLVLRLTRCCSRRGGHKAAAVGMTRLQMAEALRLMHLLEIDWSPYRHLRIAGMSGGSGWDVPSVLAWVELVQLDWHATTFGVYKSIWKESAGGRAYGSPEVAEALRRAWVHALAPRSSPDRWAAFLALFGRHGSERLQFDRDDYDWPVGRESAATIRTVEADVRWVRHAVGVASVHAFETLALEVLAGRSFPKPSPALYLALVVAALREGREGAAPVLSRLARKAAKSLMHFRRIVDGGLLTDADLVTAIDLWDGRTDRVTDALAIADDCSGAEAEKAAADADAAVEAAAASEDAEPTGKGSDYDAVLRLWSRSKIAEVAVVYRGVLHDAPDKWVALYLRDRKVTSRSFLSLADDIFLELATRSVADPATAADAAAFVETEHVGARALRRHTCRAIGRDGAWATFDQGVATVLDAVRDRLLAPDYDPTGRSFLDDVVGALDASLYPRRVADYAETHLFDASTPDVRRRLEAHLRWILRVRDVPKLTRNLGHLVPPPL
jgi:hypothetical protein